MIFRLLQQRLLQAACLLLVLGPVAGCDSTEEEGQIQLTVMTRNLYLGTDVVFALTRPGDLSDRVAQAYTDILASDVAGRAAVAEEIETTRPDLIGLQEVALLRLQDPGDYVDGTTTPNADEVVLDFLTLLQDALLDRGLTYRVVGESFNADVELPAADTTDASFFDVRLTDRDVILARPDVHIFRSGALNFETALEVPLEGEAEVSVQRGFGWVDAAMDGVFFTFVNTHLEIGGLAEPVQVAQAGELLDALSLFQDPVLLVGDFNSAADSSTTPTYVLLTEAFTDAFAANSPGDDGFTCCQDADLRHETSKLSQRIDLILYRGAADVAEVRLVGADPEDRTPSGRWPSDHAGVVATLTVDAP